MRPATILSSALLLAATSSAWPSMLTHPLDTLKRDLAPLLLERQDDPSSSAAASPSRTGDDQSASKTNASPSPTATDDQDDENGDETSSAGTAKETGTAKESGTATGKNSGTAKGSGSKTSERPKTTEFDPRLPAGGASMITPDAMSPASYYKIKDQVTFVWNYTSLSLPPKHVDVLATCTANQAMYTLTSNATWEQTQSVIWDTGKYQASATIPLLTETYTLIIHDAARDVSATAPAGYLGAWKQFTFGMYEPQPYTPMADYVCATCSSAMSLMEKQTYAFLFSMLGVTLLTFGFFTGAAGVW